MEKEELKQRCLDAIDENRDLIIQLGDDVYKTPELGYKEFKTTERMIKAFQEIGEEPETEIAYTGCKVSTPKKGNTRIAVIGELDCIQCKEHPDSTPEGNVHACGHHAQMAAMIGCAIAMADPDVQKCLAGTVNFLAVPAEEYIDADKRARLKKEGIDPEYVQVGNEINNGLLFPIGSIREHPKEMVEILNCGYDAVKEIFPDTQVVTHVSAGHILEYVTGFFDVYFRYGGKTDMIGLSYYPAWFQERHKPQEFLKVLNEIHRLYGKDIVLSEIGGIDNEEEETYHLLLDTLELTNSVEDHALKGMVYWEPEVNRAAVPDGYPLGAAKLVEKKKLHYTKALSAYKNYREEV